MCDCRAGAVSDSVSSVGGARDCRAGAVSDSVSSVGGVCDCRAGGSWGWTNAQGLKITEK